MKDNTDRWSRDFEEPPGPHAPPQEIADYIYNDVEGGGLLWGADERDFRPITTRQARRFCEAHGYPWKLVSPLLRQRRAFDLENAQKNPRLSLSDQGIIINNSLVEAMTDLRWLPRCPNIWSGFSRYDYRHFTVGQDCGKWWCPTCGVKRLEELAAQVKERIAPYETLYTAITTYEPKLPARMSYRWRAREASCFWIRRFDRNVFYVGTANLGARTEPRDWTARSQAEVLEWVKRTPLAFPGYVDHGWSAGWQPDGDRETPERGWEDLDDGETEWMWSPLNKTQAGLVHDLLRRVMHEQYDVDIDLGVPSELRTEAQGLFRSLAKRVSEEGYGGAGK